MKLRRTLSFIILLSYPVLPALAEPIFGAPGTVKTSVVENPETHFKHYVSTYIPRSLGPITAETPTVIFLHGGSGLASRTGLTVENGEFVNCRNDIHCTKEYGLNQINIYLNDGEGTTGLIRFAETYRFIAILPGSNIGWTNESSPLLRALKQDAVSELKVNPDRFVLAGHSMGAMGTVRMSGYLRSDFKAFLAFSGTLNANEMTVDYVRKLVTVPLYLVNEEEALYKSFLTQSALLKDFTDELARVYGVQNRFKFVVAHGNHNNVMNSFGDVLKKALADEQPTGPELTQNPPDLIYRPQTSNWVGNVTCGKFINAVKYHFNPLFPNKQVFVSIQAEREGLLNRNGTIDDTYLPREAKIEVSTFSDGQDYAFVKALPKTLKRMTAKNGPYVCVLLAFDKDHLKSLDSDGFFLSAGQSVDEARSQILDQYLSATQSAAR